MRPSSFRSIIILVILFLFSITTVQADSLSSLMGWPYDIPLAPGLNYSSNNPIGSEMIYNRITHLVYPVLGMPAIVEKGGELHVIVKHNNPIAYLDPTEWKIRLTTSLENPYDTFVRVGDPIAQNYDMPVKEVVFDEATMTYQLLCEIPWGAPEELFHLVIETDSFTDFQPACVRVKEEITDTFTFVHITDSQMGDFMGPNPRNQFNNGSYPGADSDLLSSQAVFENEIIRELKLLRPDFLIFTGDLYYGINITTELEYFIRIAQQTQVPIFMMPGNHDGYCYWEWSSFLHQDGHEYFARTLGPLYYSFDYGSYHFIAVNSFDGTPLRREAGRAGIVSPVDNWAGFLSEEQYDWIKLDLDAADESGKKSLLFMHHDPRGPFTANMPYPTEPFLGEGNEYWNYESETWDSNPYDNIANETPINNTGTKLLKLATTHDVTHMFIGHNHGDLLWQFMPGDIITDRFGNVVGENIKAHSPFVVVQTTTASAEVDEENGFDGYRLIQVTNGVITEINYLEDPLIQSIPAGNFWSEESNNNGQFDSARIVVTNGLPTSLSIDLEFYLTGSNGGYQIINQSNNQEIIPYDLGLGENGEVVLYAKAIANGVNVGIADLPVAPGEERQTTFAAQPNTTNQPPIASFVVNETDTDGVFEFDASESNDPDEGMLRYFWDFGDGFKGTNEITTHKYIIGDSAVVTLTVLDENGGSAVMQKEIELPPCCIDGEHNDDEDICTCGVGINSSTWPNALPLLMVFSLLLVWKLQYRMRKQG